MRIDRNGRHGKFLAPKAPPKKDYTPENRPKTLLGQILDLIRNRWRQMLVLGILKTFSAVLLVLWTVLSVLAFLSVDADGGITEVSSILFTYMVLLIPFGTLSGPGTAASAAIAMRWVHGDSPFLATEFFGYYKTHWKQGIVLSAITYCLPMLGLLLIRSYGFLASSFGILVYLPMGICFLGMLLWAMSVQLAYPMLVMWKMPLVRLLRNSFILALNHFPTLLAANLVSLLPEGLIVLLCVWFPGSFYTLLLTLLVYEAVFAGALHQVIVSACGEYVFVRYRE